MADKIRDLREKFFLVDDEYLNGYAKLCGINATGVYASMCRHSNKQQQCFPSKKLIAEELAISERSVYTAIKKLEEWNIIKIEQQGRKENGSFKNLLYTLLSKKEWKIKPSANCAVGKDCIPPSAGGAEEGNTCKETHLPPIGEKESIPFSSEAYKEEMSKDKQKSIKLIGWYFKAVKMQFPTLKAAQREIKRHIQDAAILAEYPDEQVNRAVRYVKEKFPDEWKLSTVLKYINKLN